MTLVLAVVFPIFSLIALGYLVRRSGAISETAVDGLSAYVYVVALPALLFKTVATADIQAGASPWLYWLTFFSGVAGTWILVSFIARRLFQRAEREAVMAGFSSAQANTVMVGIPLILTLFGPAGAAPIVLLLAVHLPINMLVATLLIEAAGERSLAERFAGFARSVVRHPILIAIFAGGLLRLSGFSVPAPALQIISLLAETTATVALFTLGAVIVRYGFTADAGMASTIAGAKLIVHPAIVLAIGLLVGLDPVYLGVAVIFAAAPPGINTYLLAARYRVGEAMTASAISIGTLACALTVTLWLLVLPGR